MLYSSCHYYSNAIKVDLKGLVLQLLARRLFNLFTTYLPKMMRQNPRSSVEESRNGIVRRMVNLPRNIFGNFSRAMGQGMDLISGRRQMLPTMPPNVPFHQNDQLNFPHFQQNFQEPSMLNQEEWAFLASFEQQFGTNHPFFYVCRFMDALRMAQNEQKFIFLYLHSPEHPFTPSFCRETLGSDLVVQFLDANFICWGALANRAEGIHLASTLRASTFPFCAIVAPASGDNFAVLQQIEGPVSPAELVEILQRTMEEQGLAFGSRSRAMEEEKRRADRRLREEQDVAYISSLQRDQEKEKLKNLATKQRGPEIAGPSNSSNKEKIKRDPGNQRNSKLKANPKTGEAPRKDNPIGKGIAQETKVLIRTKYCSRSSTN
ncbi:OLC1v1013107C5 [Oldenlandia corymbosa var. corymbosa]|uniref:OLC1v1013107C5 n=2 Tax=Oldenlandia corymbosa var. corymbosa TaxID=529605 RepID=A0AAV1E0S4_OLDCO|nr:OLC1v1013107C5 [Oldenlandia corymbosa var. corymbosa]